MMDSGRTEWQATHEKDQSENWYRCITRSGLQCLYINARSLVKRIDVFVALVQSQDYDVIITTETWLNEEITSAEIQMQGYDIFSGDRQIRRRGGGVLLYTKAELNATVFTLKTKFPQLS